MDKEMTTALHILLLLWRCVCIYFTAYYLLKSMQKWVRFLAYAIIGKDDSLDMSIIIRFAAWLTALYMAFVWSI